MRTAIPKRLNDFDLGRISGVYRIGDLQVMGAGDIALYLSITRKYEWHQDQ
ncbi:MAG: hypothetical protein MK317_11320 [Pseudomonadales bacterium]|nr:hypothetical protein [Pseudomonadales bacterium]